jgi:hypothetical protein
MPTQLYHWINSIIGRIHSTFEDTLHLQAYPAVLRRNMSPRRIGPPNSLSAKLFIKPKRTKLLRYDADGGFLPAAVDKRVGPSAPAIADIPTAVALTQENALAKLKPSPSAPYAI